MVDNHDESSNVTDTLFEYYMRNNEQLSDSMLQEVREILTGPRQEVKELDGEIKDIEDHLTRLKVKRAQVQETINLYDCVLSPIRRVPVDLLHNIFYHCLPPNPIISGKEAPILLTQICRTWRRTAHSSPPLWSRIHVTFSDEDMLSDPEISFGLTKTQVTEILRRRCDVVEEWLSRSGACPLSISIRYTSRVRSTASALYPEGSGLTSSIFRILARFSHRWRELELRMPIEVYLQLEKVLTISQLSMLNTLRGTLFRQKDVLHGELTNEANVVGILQAQNLRKILLLAHTPIWNIRTSTVGPNWMNITNLCCNWSMTTTEAALLFRASPNLEYLTVILMSDEIQDLSAAHSERLYLQHLRAISIVDTTRQEGENNIYALIDAPRLKWIDYTIEMHSYIAPGNQVPQNLTYSSQDTPTIVALLRSSSELKKLTIEASSFSSAALRKVLESAHTITHLVLGPESRTAKNNPQRSPFIMYTSPLWDFGDVFHVDNMGGMAGTGLTVPPRLLPHLEVLEISEGVSTKISDETLLNFIINRLPDPSSSFSSPSLGDPAYLKHVSVMFDRVELTALGITKRIKAHAEGVGRDIKLDFNYCDELRPGSVSFVSPEYGLDQDGQSWRQRDLEYEMALLPY